MKKIGIIILLIGLVGLALVMGMDTSVATGHGDERVHNIGLMSEKQNYLFVAIAFAVVGAVLLAIGLTKAASQGPGDRFDASQQSRACPFCAEQIKPQAIVCRFCGKGVEPSMEKFTEEVDRTTFDSMSWRINGLHRVVASIRAQKRRYLIGCIVAALMSVVGLSFLRQSDDDRIDEMCRAPDRSMSWDGICQYRDGLTPEAKRRLIQMADQVKESEARLRAAESELR